MRRNNYLLLALMIGSFGANMVRCQVSPEPAPPKTSRPGVLLLAKPYRKQQLAQMIRAALGAVDDNSSGDTVAGSAQQQAV